MARPVSWLPRLHSIISTIKGSVRSHYGREDIERVFELGPRAALRLLELLPTTGVGTSLLVAREDLLAMVERVRASEDVAALLEQMREENARSSRKALRSLVRRDIEPPSLSGLPEGLVLDVGRVTVDFDTVEELGRKLLALALLLETEGDEIARQYEPSPEIVEDTAAADVRALFAELEAMESEKKKGAHKAPPSVESSAA